MPKARFGTLGDLTTAAAGSAVDVSDCEEVTVTVTFSVLDGSALKLQYCIGTAWFDAPGVGTFTSASFSESGSYIFPMAVEQIRAYGTTANGATMYVRYGALDKDVRG